jgi:FkbM family methyltransferase
MQSVSKRQQKQSFVTRIAAWYFRDFPWRRGRGLANRVFGRFLQVKVFDGVSLRLINPLEYHQWMLLCANNAFENDVTQLLSTALRPGMVFFDIGANLGYYTLLASARVGRQGHVHAFEPAPAQYRHLEMNARLNQARNVTLNNCALAETAEEREFYLSEGWNHGTHSLGNAAGKTGGIRISCATLDEYVHRARVARIDVMKVDVEGAEWLVFRGGERTFSLAPPRLLVFEACERHAQALGFSTVEVKKFLARRGYSIYRLRPSALPAPASAFSVEEFANLAAVHSSAKNRWRVILNSIGPMEQEEPEEWSV